MDRRPRKGPFDSSRVRVISSVLLGATVIVGVSLTVVGANKPTATVVASDAGLAYASVGPGINEDPRPAAVASSNGFTITGSVTGLFPGATVPLVLAVQNPNTYAITVTSMVTAVSATRAGCPSGNLTVTPFSGFLWVAPKHTSRTLVNATMAHAAPDQCQGAVFLLRYSGRGSVP